MGFSSKAKQSNEGWGTMGFFFVFFPEDFIDYINKKKTISSSSFKSNSTLLLSKAQSTISICALFIFFTLLLFTLCTFEPPITSSQFSRRYLIENSSKDHNFRYESKNKRPSDKNFNGYYRRRLDRSFALQGMGILFRRGTKAMNDLVVGHLMEDLKEDDLRLFLRTLHRSGLTSRSDVLLIFPSRFNFSGVVQEENDSFLRLVRSHRESKTGTELTSGFDVTQFVKSGEKEKERGEPLWGRRIHGNYSNAGSELTQLSWGSVVGFEADELDSENSLAGFLDNVPMGLSMWACFLCFSAESGGASSISCL